MADERHECWCGKPATRWQLVVLLDLTHCALWECDAHYRETLERQKADSERAATKE